MPSIVVGTWDAAVNETKILALVGVYISSIMRKTNICQVMLSAMEKNRAR